MIDRVAYGVRLPEFARDACAAARGRGRHVPSGCDGKGNSRGCLVNPVGLNLAKLTQPRALGDLNPMTDIVAGRIDLAAVLPGEERTGQGYFRGRCAVHRSHPVESE